MHNGLNITLTFSLFQGVPSSSHVLIQDPLQNKKNWEILGGTSQNNKVYCLENVRSIVLLRLG